MSSFEKKRVVSTEAEQGREVIVTVLAFLIGAALVLAGAGLDLGWWSP